MRTRLATASPAVLLLVALFACFGAHAVFAQDTQPSWTVDPASVAYGRISAAADPVTRTVTVTPPDGVEGTAIAFQRSFSAAVSARVTAPAEGERTWRVDITLDPRKATATGDFNSKVMLSTGNADTPIVSVTVTATIEATRLQLLAFYIGDGGRIALDRLKPAVDKVVAATQAAYEAKPQDDDTAFAQLFSLKQRYAFVREDSTQTIEMIVLKPDGTAVHLVGEAEIAQGLAELETGGDGDPGVGSSSSGNNSAAPDGQLRKIPVVVYLTADIDVPQIQDAARRFREAVGGVAELHVRDLTDEVFTQFNIQPQLPEGRKVKCLALVQFPDSQQVHWAVSENGDAIIQAARRIVLHFNPTAFDNEANTANTSGASGNTNAPAVNSAVDVNAPESEAAKVNTVTWDAFMWILLIMMVLLVGFTLLFVNMAVERAMTKAGRGAAAAGKADETGKSDSTAKDKTAGKATGNE